MLSDSSKLPSCLIWLPTGYPARITRSAQAQAQLRASRSGPLDTSILFSKYLWSRALQYASYVEVLEHTSTRRATSISLSVFSSVNCLSISRQGAANRSAAHVAEWFHLKSITSGH